MSASINWPLWQWQNGKIFDLVGRAIPVTMPPELAEQIIERHNHGTCINCGTRPGLVEDQLGRCPECIKSAKEEAADDMLKALHACHDTLLMLDRAHSRAFKMAEFAIKRQKAGHDSIAQAACGMAR